MEDGNLTNLGALAEQNLGGRVREPAVTEQASKPRREVRRWRCLEELREKVLAWRERLLSRHRMANAI